MSWGSRSPHRIQSGAEAPHSIGPCRCRLRSFQGGVYGVRWLSTALDDLGAGVVPTTLAWDRKGGMGRKALRGRA